MPDSDFSEARSALLDQIGELTAMSPVEADSLFSIIILPERKAVAWGRSLDDPKIVALCNMLKEKRVAFSVRPQFFPSDGNLAESLSKGEEEATCLDDKDVESIKSGTNGRT